MGCFDNLKKDICRNWQDFKGFMWNPRTKEFFGRDAKSWCEIFIFYIIFYGLLACWWSGLLYARVYFLPEISEGPFHTEYIPHRGPGMKMIPPPGGNGELRYNKDKNESYEGFVNAIDSFFEEYMEVAGVAKEDFEVCASNQSAVCSATSSVYLNGLEVEIEVNVTEDEAENSTSAEKEAMTEKVKLFNVLNLGECYTDEDHGFAEGEPCLFFSVNKAYGWTPKPLSESPKDLTTSDEFMPFSCKGYKSQDQDLLEEVKIMPEQGFKIDYFPWEGQENYVKPLVAAKFKFTPEAYGSRVRVECKIYADNIYHKSTKPNIGRVEIKFYLSEDGDVEYVEEEVITTAAPY